MYCQAKSTDYWQCVPHAELPSHRQIRMNGKNVFLDGHLSEWTNTSFLLKVIQVIFLYFMPVYIYIYITNFLTNPLC